MSKQAIPLLSLTLTAGGTLSANRFIDYDGTTPAAGAAAFGVTRSSASSGDSITVDVAGVVAVETGGVFAAGVEVQCDSSGRVVEASSGVTLGIALQASTGSGQFVMVLLRDQFGGTKFNNVLAHNDITEVSANGALPVSGVSLITGGAGLASLTLAAPQPGCMARLRVVSTSGNVVVTTAAGVTFDGTNNTATFNAAADELILGYKSATQWLIIQNTSVTLSSV